MAEALVGTRLNPENMPRKCRGCRFAKGCYVWQLCIRETCKHTKARKPRPKGGS
jgi:hypothetical protein